MYWFWFCQFSTKYLFENLNKGTKRFNPATFYWSACANPGKWAVMYLCVRGTDFASFCDFSIGFWNYSDNVVFGIHEVINKELWRKQICVVFSLICYNLI
jgi:hypothetical protein